MSREIHLSMERKRIRKRAKTIRVEPKLSAKVREGLRELYQMEVEK